MKIKTKLIHLKSEKPNFLVDQFRFAYSVFTELLPLLKSSELLFLLLGYSICFMSNCQ